MYINKNLDVAYEVDFPFWQAPNDYVLLKTRRDNLVIFTKIWKRPGKYSKKIGVIHFSGVWSMRFERNKYLKYYENTVSSESNSCYWIVPGSTWLEELKQSRRLHFSDWEKYDFGNYTHYIVQSNSFYIEIVAKLIHISKAKLKKKINLDFNKRSLLG